jgi:hypothetical protein
VKNAEGTDSKPATAARIYDYLLGGVHNFPADREAAKQLLAQFPRSPLFARTNRAFVGRAVRFLVGAGVRQFLDIGSGIPTEGNVHEIAQELAPEVRVVYVDVDPVAVAESQELLEGNDLATAVRADMRSPREILAHREVRKLLDLNEPLALLLAAVLHFVPDDDEAYGLVTELTAALAPGSYLVISHGAKEAADRVDVSGQKRQAIRDIYQRQTTSMVKGRTRAAIEKFFTGTTLVEPGLVWSSEWRPDRDEEDEELARNPWLGYAMAGIGKI